ncbi:MAG: DotH/IcmK family type IV secretion protein [Pseudomonadota bacterium]|nr:DotH/IcmK family type IV secretion protein [Pseudomonadota bacterium]
MKIYGMISRPQHILSLGATLLLGALLTAPLNAQAASATDDPTAATSDLPPLSPGIAIPSPAPSAMPQLQPATAPSTTTTTTTTTSIPTPPPSAGGTLSTDAAQLAAQAEKAALQAQAQAENEQAKRDREHSEKSFDRAAAGLLPLSADQIRTFMRKLEVTQEASIPPSSGPPKGEVRVATLPLDPGVSPPQINLASGYVTTITLVDSTGEPWPISDVGIGGNFEVTPATVGSHVIRIMPLTQRGAGNLSVLMKNLPTPVIFRLSAGGPTVDLRYDARIPRMGPNAKTPLIERPNIEAGGADIMMMLENTPPKDAKRMKISGLDARTMAWSFNKKVFVRTPLTLLSPAWDSSVSSADGMTVYEIGEAPVLLMSDNGAMVRGRLVQEDDHD